MSGLSPGKELALMTSDQWNIGLFCVSAPSCMLGASVASFTAADIWNCLPVFTLLVSAEGAFFSFASFPLDAQLPDPPWALYGRQRFNLCGYRIQHILIEGIVFTFSLLCEFSYNHYVCQLSWFFISELDCWTSWRILLTAVAERHVKQREAKLSLNELFYHVFL